MKFISLAVLFILLIHAVPVWSKGIDITFNLGPSLSQSGNVKDLGDPNLSTGFGFNYFFNPNHGLGLGYNNESVFEGTSKFPGLRDASISTFDLHYTYRHIKDKFHFVFEPGIGKQTLHDQTSDYYWGELYTDDLSTALILNYKIFIRYVVTDWKADDPSMDGYFFLGAGFMHHFSYDDSLNGKDISGNRLASVFQLGVGW